MIEVKIQTTDEFNQETEFRSQCEQDVVYDMYDGQLGYIMSVFLKFLRTNHGEENIQEYLNTDNIMQ